MQTPSCSSACGRSSTRLATQPPGLHFVGPSVRTGVAGSAAGRGGPISTGHDPSSTSRRARSPTSTTTQAIAPTLQALADEDVLVVVSTGGRPLDTLPPLPANARAATYLPYDELLPRTAVYVTNGGYGGVQYALRYGVPIVATGGKEDKPEVGARVAWSGVWAAHPLGVADFSPQRAATSWP